LLIPISITSEFASFIGQWGLQALQNFDSFPINRSLSRLVNCGSGNRQKRGSDQSFLQCYHNNDFGDRGRNGGCGRWSGKRRQAINDSSVIWDVSAIRIKAQNAPESFSAAQADKHEMRKKRPTQKN
jgi:hypothetical protein